MPTRISLCVLVFSCAMGCSQSEPAVVTRDPKPTPPTPSASPTLRPAPPAETSDPGSPPTQEDSRTVVEPAPKLEARTAQEPPGPEPPEPETAPAPEDELPPYIQLLRRIQPTQVATLQPELRAPRTVEITTANVERFRISRHGLPLRSSGSLVLRVDGQVFEWTRQRVTVEFVFTPSGGWSVVRPDEPEP